VLCKTNQITPIYLSTFCVSYFVGPFSACQGGYPRGGEPIRGGMTGVYERTSHSFSFELRVPSLAKIFNSSLHKHSIQTEYGEYPQTFRGILPVPQNIVMYVNNVMRCHCVCFLSFAC
jgi:hypothetical protein